MNEKDGIYYGDGYWNELDAVRRMFNQRISGRTVGPWFHDFAVGRSEPFRRALILNCGNGWVEREMVSANVMAEAVGIDYSEALLDEARQAASTDDLPLQYHQMNVNAAAFPSEAFDLVVNYAGRTTFRSSIASFVRFAGSCRRTAGFCHWTTSARIATSTRLRHGSGRGASTTSCRRRCASA